MSYRLITKATLTTASSESLVDIRAYAAPKSAPVGTLHLNGAEAPFKLTGGQGRGSVVRCYMYFMLNAESAYIEITKAQFDELKAGYQPTVYTQAKVIEPVAAEPVAAEPVVEETKAKRKGRKAKGTEEALV